VLIFLTMLETDAERQLFMELYNQYGNAMLRVAQRYFLGEPTMAEDAVQNAWLRVVEKFSRLQDIPRKKRGAYLVVIAKNESISLLRKRHQELPFDDTIVADKGDFESDNAKDIIETIQKMPETYRAVIEMRFVEELSTKEIAVALGLKETTVNVRIHRGRALLMKKLREEGYVK
jgi:RNA polymerase sigma-70 factor (ECF subfamily)